MLSHSNFRRTLDFGAVGSGPVHPRQGGDTVLGGGKTCLVFGRGGRRLCATRICRFAQLDGH